MKRILLVAAVTLALGVSAPAVRAHGGGGYGWHGGCGWGHGGWCGWWPAFGLGLGLGVAASYPAYAYSYPAYAYSYPAYSYTYAPATYTYAQPVHVAAPPATTSIQTTYHVVPVQQQYVPAVAPAPAAPQRTVTTVAVHTTGTWIQDPNPYRYVPVVQPNPVVTRQPVVVAPVSGPAPVYVAIH
jgi:hypothetical protein